MSSKEKVLWGLLLRELIVVVISCLSMLPLVTFNVALFIKYKIKVKHSYLVPRADFK